MEESATAKRVLRFGLYEVDFASQELRKSGIKIKIQDQPFQILALLLERPGQVVTREEIQKRLWAGDTFVDFDLGLNSAVKKLRQALGDESDNPRFIETLYRRGYRFLAPIQSDANPSASSVTNQPQPTNGKNGQTLHGVLDLPQKANTPGAKGANRRLSYMMFPVLLVVGILGGYWIRPPAKPKVTGYQQITQDGRQKYSITSDGERLYLQEYDSGHFVIGQVSAAGGETSLLSSPFTNTMMGSITPDGSTLLVGAYRGTNKQATIWSLPLPTGAPRRIGDLVAASVVPTPDGKSLIFSADSAVYEASADGGQVHKLFATGGPTFGLAISPDGRKFCFNVNDLQTGTNGIWEANRDGSNVHALFPADQLSQHDSGARWTPDGKYLVFQRFSEGHENIWILPEGGHALGSQPGPVQLTNGPLDFGGLLPSKDGKKIFAVGAHPRTELMRYDEQSGFKPFMGGISVTDLAFSNDGAWVTYVSVPDNTLWRSKVDGSERMQLTDPGKVLAGLPRWSPDGKQIAFMGRTLSTNWRVYLISANGGAFRELVAGSPAGLDPTWTPDGKSIVLSLDNMGATGRGISVVDLETRKVSDLPGSDHLFSPRVSPDGKWIAAITTDSQTLVLFDVASQKWTELLRMPIGYPSWSQNGQYLYFDSILSEDPGLYRIRISDRKMERLAGLSGIRRFWGPLAEWTGLAPDDSFLLTRDNSNQEVYAIDWSPN